MNPQPTADTRFKRILFCTDFSDSAQAAFDFALDALTRRPGSMLYILHIVPEADAQFWRSYLHEVDDVEASAGQAMKQRAAEQYLARVPAGFEAKFETRSGPEAPAILDFAREHGVDLMVIGRHGHGGVQKALFGSVAEKLVRKAGCAVMVIPLSYARGTPA